MKTEYSYKLVLMVLVTLFHQMFVLAFDDNAVINAMFDVIPGGHTLNHKEHWGNLYCEFTYSCVGGTKEEWFMSISKDNEDNYVCKVERHEGITSYLYFSSFELKIGGGKLLEGIIFSKSPDKAAKEDEYIVNHDKNTISDSPNFQNGLHRAYAIFNQKGRTEL